jgi:hypothetical protein
MLFDTALLLESILMLQRYTDYAMKRMLGVCTLFLLSYCSSHNGHKPKESINLLNEIIRDTKLQMPYIGHRFYTEKEEVIAEVDLAPAYLESIMEQNKQSDTLFDLKTGDLTFFDHKTRALQPATVTRHPEERVNKYVLHFTTPYRLSENEVIVFFTGHDQSQPGAASQSTWANQYEKINGRWVLIKSYSLAEVS